MTTTEHAAHIRQTLKTRHGWSSRDVSVRADYYSMGSSIRIHIKNPNVSSEAVKAIAEQAEHIDYCAYSGEILGGGNTYVHVRYSHEAQTIIGRRWTDAVQRAVNVVEPGSNVLQPVEGTEFLVGRPHQYRITLWDRDRYLGEGGNVDQIAETIGALMVAREPTP